LGGTSEITGTSLPALPLLRYLAVVDCDAFDPSNLQTVAYLKWLRVGLTPEQAQNTFRFLQSVDTLELWQLTCFETAHIDDLRRAGVKHLDVLDLEPTVQLNVLSEELSFLTSIKVTYDSHHARSVTVVDDLPRTLVLTAASILALPVSTLVPGAESTVPGETRAESARGPYADTAECRQALRTNLRKLGVTWRTADVRIERKTLIADINDLSCHRPCHAVGDTGTDAGIAAGLEQATAPINRDEQILCDCWKHKLTAGLH
jgi:hypothetical protein